MDCYVGTLHSSCVDDDQQRQAYYWIVLRTGRLSTQKERQLQSPSVAKKEVCLANGNSDSDSQADTKTLQPRVVERFLSAVESRQVQPSKDNERKIGKLQVDQSLPWPRLMQIKKTVLQTNSQEITSNTYKNRNLAVFEIIETEVAYVESLDLLIELLIEPLKKPTMEDDAIEIISREDIDTIFSDIVIIRGVSCELVKALESRLANWTNNELIADIFIQMAPYFKCYCRYVDNYPRAIARVKELSQTNYAFRDLLTSFSKNPRTKKLDIFSFLIKPIQRISKYSLLLEAVAKYTSPDHPDMGNIQQAIEEMRKVADYVNTSAAHSESRAKVYEIQTRFIRIGSKNIVEPARRFLKEGIMYKYSLRHGTVRKLVVYLFSDLLLTAVPLVGAQKQDKFIELVTACVVDKIDGPYAHMFYVATPGKTHAFICESRQAKSDWMAEINRAISILISGNISLAAQREKYDLITANGIPQMTAHNSTTPSNDQFSRKMSLQDILAHTVHKILDLGQPRLALAPPLDFSDDSNAINVKESQDDIDDDIASFELINTDASSKRQSILLDSPDLASNLLRNKGAISILAPHVRECTGKTMWQEDKIHESSYPIESTYIVFPESYRNILGMRWIGTIVIQNDGDTHALLVSHVRRSIDRPTYYKLMPGEKKRFDYRGWWCIEVRQGDCSKLRVLEFSIDGGTGTNNDLKMV